MESRSKSASPESLQERDRIFNTSANGIVPVQAPSWLHDSFDLVRRREHDSNELDLLQGTDEVEKGAESDDDDLAEVLSSTDSFGTSVPSADYFTPGGAQSPIASYALDSLRSGMSSYGPIRSFATARSSLASYATAPDSFRNVRTDSTRPSGEVDPAMKPTKRVYNSVFNKQLWPDFVNLIEAIDNRRNSWSFGHSQRDIYALKSGILERLVFNLDWGSPVASLEPTIGDVTSDIEAFERGRANGPDIVTNDIRLDVAVEVYLFALLNDHLKSLVPNGLFIDGRMSNSEWLRHLHSRGILPSEAQALDWSGRGQHAEYFPHEESQIPLVEGKVLGHSMSAIVQSVQCRRIQLARKTIRCTRRFTKETAVTEVQHLQRMQHRHIVRLVGTYTLRKSLAILLYPAARWNLDEFLDDFSHASVSSHNRHMAWRFFGCLANAMAFIHGQNVKHLDIKPGNILVHSHREDYRIYIADFGIARAYKSAEESNTDSPTSFTRIYAAPEVTTQDLRGYSADIFSLGCVFLEILEVLLSELSFHPEQTLSALRTGDRSYSANLEAVLGWCNMVHMKFLSNWIFSDRIDALLPRGILGDGEWILLCRDSLNQNPNKRPSAGYLRYKFDYLSCGCCGEGPGPFEAVNKEIGDEAQSET